MTTRTAVIHVCLMLFSALLAPCLGGSIVTGKNPTQKQTFLKHVRSLPIGKYIHLIDQLRKQKNLRSLRWIYTSNLPNSSIAAGAYAAAIDSDKVIRFCADLELTSDNWIEAFYSLRLHPKRKVIGYIKQVATSSIPEARYMCYVVCESKAWKDLNHIALQDVKSKYRIVGAGATASETLGQAAKNYLEKISRK